MSFGKQFFHYIIAEGVGRVFPLFLLPWIAKNLAVQDFGLYSLFQLYLTFGIVIFMLGTDQSLFRFVPESPGEAEKKWLSTAVIFTLAAGIVLSLIFFPLKLIFKIQLFDVNTLFSLRDLLVIIVIASINNQYFTYFKARQKSKKYIYLFLSRLGLFYAIFILLVLFKFGQYSFIYAYYGAELFAFITMTIVLIRHFRFPDMEYLKKMLHFGLPMFIITILGILIYQADHYMIKYFMGVSSVGEYNFSYKYAAAASSIVLLINRVWLPRVYESGKPYLKSTVQSVMGFTLIFYLLIFLTIFTLFLFLKGTSYLPDNFNYVELFPILGIGYLVYAGLQLLDAYLLLEKRTWLLSGFYTFIFILNIGGNLWAIPRFGLIGAAYTTLLSFLILWILLFYSFLKDKEFKTELRNILIYFGLILIIAVLTVILEVPLTTELMIIIILPFILKKMGIKIHYKKLIHFDIDHAIELSNK